MPDKKSKTKPAVRTVTEIAVKTQAENILRIVAREHDLNVTPTILREYSSLLLDHAHGLVNRIDHQTPGLARPGTMQFVKDYPRMLPMSGNLYELACPRCGHRESFTIQCGGRCTVTEHQVEPADDLKWTERSLCACESCGFEAKVRDFTFIGLEDEIRSDET